MIVRCGPTSRPAQRSQRTQRANSESRISNVLCGKDAFQRFDANAAELELAGLRLQADAAFLADFERLLDYLTVALAQSDVAAHGDIERVPVVVVELDFVVRSDAGIVADLKLRAADEQPAV